MHCLRTLLLRQTHKPRRGCKTISVSSLDWKRWSTSSRQVQSSIAITDEEDHARYCYGGYHPVCLDEVFNRKYQIVSKLGFGVYSTVWLAKDTSQQDCRYLALKILTADSFGSTKPTFELDILKHLKRNQNEHAGSDRIVHLSDSFVHEGPHGRHLCLVLELMGPSVADLKRAAHKKQLPQRICKAVASHMLQALDWLHETCHVIHTDIKPSNILTELPNVREAVEQHLMQFDIDNIDGLARLRSRSIASPTDLDANTLAFRLTDFGVASWREKHLTEWIQPLSLRAPEVFLHASWDTSADIWNFACLMYELAQGRVLFRGTASARGTWTAEEDQLGQMIELFGPLPASLLNKGRITAEYFDDNGEMLHIKQFHPSSLQQLFAMTKNSSMSVEDYKEFESFLVAMLKYEPSERKSAKEAANMSWLRSVDLMM